MTPQAAFLAGMFTGTVVTFIVSAYFLWRPVVLDYQDRYRLERDRRIEAEDQQHAQFDEEVRIIGEFPPVADFLPRVETHPADNKPWSGEGRPLDKDNDHAD